MGEEREATYSPVGCLYVPVVGVLSSVKTLAMMLAASCDSLGKTDMDRLGQEERNQLAVSGVKVGSCEENGEAARTRGRPRRTLNTCCAGGQ